MNVSQTTNYLTWSGVMARICHGAYLSWPPSVGTVVY